jgi:hypothetical protein
MYLKHLSCLTQGRFSVSVFPHTQKALGGERKLEVTEVTWNVMMLYMSKLIKSYH